MEAEVKCRRCKQLRWVPWEIRHDGHNVTAEKHKDARCPACPTGADFTDYTGQMQGDYEPGTPPYAGYI